MDGGVGDAQGLWRSGGVSCRPGGVRGRGGFGGVVVGRWALWVALLFYWESSTGVGGWEPRIRSADPRIRSATQCGRPEAWRTALVDRWIRVVTWRGEPPSACGISPRRAGGEGIRATSSPVGAGGEGIRATSSPVGAGGEGIRATSSPAERGGEGIRAVSSRAGAGGEGIRAVSSPAERGGRGDPGGIFTRKVGGVASAHSEMAPPSGSCRRRRGRPCGGPGWRGWEPPPQSLRDSSPSGGAIGSGCSGVAASIVSSLPLPPACAGAGFGSFSWFAGGA